MQNILIKGFVALNISQTYVDQMIIRIIDAPTDTVARKIFETFKRSVKSRYYKEAIRCHPDCGGNEEDFKEFGQLLKTLDEIDVISSRRSRNPVTSWYSIVLTKRGYVDMTTSKKKSGVIKKDGTSKKSKVDDNGLPIMSIDAPPPKCKPSTKPRKKPTRMGSVFIDRMFAIHEQVSVQFNLLELAQLKVDSLLIKGVIGSELENATLSLVAKIKRMECQVNTARLFLDDSPHSGLLVEGFKEVIGRWDSNTQECWNLIKDLF